MITQLLLLPFWPGVACRCSMAHGAVEHRLHSPRDLWEWAVLRALQAACPLLRNTWRSPSGPDWWFIHSGPPPWPFRERVLARPRQLKLIHIVVVI